MVSGWPQARIHADRLLLGRGHGGAYPAALWHRQWDERPDGDVRIEPQLAALTNSVRWIIRQRRGATSAAGTRRISQLRSSARSNEIHWPSGDHFGDVQRPGTSTSCFASVPSAFMTQMRYSPVRSEPKTILTPSGDHAGQPSNAGGFVRLRAFSPSASMTNTSELPAST